MKKYWILLTAAILLVIGVLTWVFHGNDFRLGSYTMHFFSSGDYALGVFSAGKFSIGLFSIGLFSTGLFLSKACL